MSRPPRTRASPYESRVEHEVRVAVSFGVLPPASKKRFHLALLDVCERGRVGHRIKTQPGRDHCVDDCGASVRLRFLDLLHHPGYIRGCEIRENVRRDRDPTKN